MWLHMEAIISSQKGNDQRVPVYGLGQMQWSQRQGHTKASFSFSDDLPFSKEN